MPMSPEDRQQVLLSVGEVLKVDIHTDLMSLYAAAVALSERHPEQVNNEIRNAVTHLCRALNAENLDEARRQISLAQNSHIERAKRDCLKLSIAELTDEIRLSIDHIRLKRGTLPPELLVRRKNLLRKRELALVRDIEGIEGVLNCLAEVFNEMKDFSDELVGNLNLPTSKIDRWRANFILLDRFLLGSLFTIAIALLAFFISAILVPDTNVFGLRARSILSSVFTLTNSSDNPQKRGAATKSVIRRPA